MNKLTEGAIAGHMMHMYENTDLSFADIAKVLSDAAEGRLEFTEKTDGQNNYLSFNVKDSEARAARNKDHQKKGGVNIAGLRTFFTTERVEAGKNPAPESVVRAFEESMISFERVVKKFPHEVQEELFLDESDNPIFYNTEVMAVENPNVVSYDKDTLLIQQTGHKKRDPETGHFENLESDEISKYLEALKTALEKFNDEVREQKFSFEINQIKKLNVLEEENILEKAISSLQKEASSAGIGMNETIGDYLIAKIDKYIIDSGFYFPESVQMKILNIFLQIADPGDTKKEFLVRDINHLKELIKQNGESEKTGFQLTQIEKFRDKSFVAATLKKAIKPIEIIIHEFAVEVLRGFESAWIIDNSEKADGLARYLDDAVKTLERASTDYEAIVPVLQSQLTKLKRVDDQFDISTPVEGIVFSYKGATYKFTGNFAPFNQLNGLFTFGRSGVPALKGKYEPEEEKQMELLEQEGSEENITYVFIPGGFKPPHKGHISLVRQAYEQNESANIVIMSGKEHRGGSEGEVLVTWEQAEKIFNILLESAGFIMGAGARQVQIDYFDPIDTGRISKAGKPILTRSPIHRIGQFVQDFESGSEITIVSSKADEKYGEIFEKVLSHYTDEINIKTVALNTADIKEGEKISATVIRRTIEASDDASSIAQFYPDNLPPEQLELIFNILKGEIKNEDIVYEELISMVENTLSEMSSMAGSSIAGYSAPGPDDLEEEQMNIKEKKLRDLVRRVIKIKKRKIEEQKLKEEKLRYLIRRLLIVEAKNESPPHRLTSINVLDDFFNLNATNVERVYKKLSSSEKQRDSFKKHFINAIVNKLQLENVYSEIKRFVIAKSEKSDFAVRQKAGLFEQDLKVKIGDTGMLEKEPEEEELEAEKELERTKPEDFSEEEQLEGLDPIGRQHAATAFNAVIENIITARDGLLGDDTHALDPSEPDSPEYTERQIFTFYLFLNFELYFRLWEERYFAGVGPEVEEIESAAEGAAEKATPEMPETGEEIPVEEPEEGEEAPVEEPEEGEEAPAEEPKEKEVPPAI